MSAGAEPLDPDRRPHVLVLVTDQQRADTIAALGNPAIATPHMDRLVERGVAFTRAYSTCPVCVPARYTLRSGCEPIRTDVFENEERPTMTDDVRAATGPFLAEVMAARGYRTFGIGKFHTFPWDADLGYEVHLRAEELYGTPDQRRRDAYASFVAREHPEYDFVEMLMGERTEMYYVPQMSPLPARLGMESWAADRAIELLRVPDRRPFFGVVSFIGPHPPFAPPIPYNRRYDPDAMTDPVVGTLEVDHADEQIPWMNYAVYADDISPGLARILKARYYGEISYIDDCIGRILDALEEVPGGDQAVVCLVSDHGEHLGDHHAWQKESYFEAATRVPSLLSYPGRLPAGVRRDDLVALSDLFGLVTGLTGLADLRDGHDVLGSLLAGAPARERLVAVYGRPGTRRFKVMVREGHLKYVHLANGGRQLLFDLGTDPDELVDQAPEHPGLVERLAEAAASELAATGCPAALDPDRRRLWSTSFRARPRRRIHQFDASRGVSGFG